MSDEVSLEGWAPGISSTLTLAEIVDRAFDYRGDVTVVKTDQSEVVGYVFNRDRHAPEPFIQMFEVTRTDPVVIRYSEIQSIRFTGKDPAAGTSYAAWLRRRTSDAGEPSVPPVSPSR